MGEKLLYSPKELLESGLFPGGRNALYNLLQSDGFPKLRIGHRLYIPREGYLDWIRNPHANELSPQRMKRVIY